MYGIYIHVPFCIRKCPYCDFYSTSASAEVREAYLSSLCNQIISFAPVQADTVYFGGGTPTLLDPSQISKVMEVLISHHSISSDSEITMECNPATADEERFRGYLDAGINRLSIGCQSFDGRCLSKLGRLHSSEDSVRAFEDARKAGFKNISVDIMLGIPFEDPEIAASDARKAAELGADHVSAYLLRLCEGTPFGNGVPGIPDDDVQAECYRSFCREMDLAGLCQYEISNFSRPGFESRHNLKYWECGQWLGLGPAAHMSNSLTRWSFPADLKHYIASFSGGPVDDPVSLMHEEGTVDAEEYIITSLRTVKGLNTASLHERFGISFSPDRMSFLKKCAQSGLVELSGSNIRLTRDGFLVSNSILTELI